MKDTGKREKFNEKSAVRETALGRGMPWLIPTRMARRLSVHLEKGALKYSPHNWRSGMPLSRYVDAIYRHTWDFIEGDRQEDHLSAIVCNAMFLGESLEMIENGEMDGNFDDLTQLHLSKKKMEYSIVDKTDETV